MNLWLVLVAMTLAGLAAAVLPLFSGRATRREGTHSDGRPDMDVYRDQLVEIDTDQAEGRVGDAEAEAARAEIARRLIAAERNDREPGRHEISDRRLRWPAAGLVALAPIFALAAYLMTGQPGQPGSPLAARTQASVGDASLDELVARMEAHLLANPDDGEGWNVIAPIYLRHGRPADGAMAYRNVIRLLGPSSGRYADLGEALAAAEGGMISSDAQAAFQAALSDDPGNPKAQFYMALAAEQDGDLSRAAEIWQSMLESAPADAPWRQPVRSALARITEKSAAEPSPAPFGPNADDIAAAAELSQGDRQEMIATMVSGLAAKLEAEPDNPDGWLMLVRAYMVMGRPDDAQSAATTALESITDREARQRWVDQAVQLGVSLPEESAP